MELKKTNEDTISYGRKYHFYYNADNNSVICTRSYKDQTIRGVAKCDPEDNFNMNDGKKLSYLRCRKKHAKKKRNRAHKAYMDALIAAAAAQDNLSKMRGFFGDSEIQLQNATEELEAFENMLNCVNNNDNT